MTGVPQNGAFEALKLGYLAKMVFMIYLDSEDPTNIIESYTFNITYERVGDSAETHPVMHITKQMKNVAIQVDQGDQRSSGLTEIDVKNSLRGFISYLLLSMDMMSSLPRKCYVNFKLYYTDSTPEDYEPPCFIAGDPEQETSFLKTSSPSERPDVFASQPARTGHHGLTIRIASIAKYLPVINAKELHLDGPDKEDALLEYESRTHAADAGTRTTAWDVGTLSADPDPSDMDCYVPETPCRTHSSMDVDAEYGGRAPPQRRLQSLAQSRPSASETMQATQVVETQIDYPETQAVPETPRLNTSNPADVLRESPTIADDDSPVHDMARVGLLRPLGVPPPAIQCYCNLASAQDTAFQCDGPCQKWVHVWCMGFHTNDPRLDGDRKCFDCRVAEDTNSVTLQRKDVYNAARAEFSDLVVYRRALQIVKLHSPATMTKFKELSHVKDAKKLWARLEKDGFIARKSGPNKKIKCYAPTTQITTDLFNRYFTNDIPYDLLNIEQFLPFAPATPAGVRSRLTLPPAPGPR
ncbi:hypothetical protein AURDEDRAFT_157716 [Auricularia subglabra TFB-10046 SS5]|nr:hypothetical protein AURDEDRAFT_157716 [Auricularia subglabra TFB-10046 SS5]